MGDADAFAAHLDDYELDRYNDAVLKMEQVPGGWSFSVGKEIIVGKAVVICSGANPRPLGVPRETELTGRGVSYCALCDGNFFRDQVVAVVAEETPRWKRRCIYPGSPASCI